MEDNYYAIKDAGEITIKGKDYELHIDIANEIHTISADNTSVMIVSVQLTSDELEEKLKNIKGSEIKLDLKCKSYLTGEYIYKERVFKNMRFIKQEVRYSYDRPSDILLVFANKKHSKVKEILNEYLNRNNIVDCIGNIEGKLWRVAEELNKIDNTIGLASMNIDNFKKDIIRETKEDITKILEGLYK